MRVRVCVLRLLAVSASIAALVATPAQPTTVTGTIDVSIVLTAGCTVNGALATSAMGFGELDFGVQDPFFTNADAQVLNSSSGALSVKCSNGAGATLRITGGENDGAVATHPFAMTNGTQHIGYALYSDAARTTLITTSTEIPITSDGTEQTVNLYARAFGTTGLPAGTYGDSLSASLIF